MYLSYDKAKFQPKTICLKEKIEKLKSIKKSKFFHAEAAQQNQTIQNQ